MDVELVEIQDFLARFPPFDLLPCDVIADLARSIEIRYARKGTVLLAPGDQARFLCLVRAGAVETRDAEGELLARLGEGECFGVRSLLRGGTAYLHTTALEDTLLYQLPAASFEALRRTHRHVEYYFGAQAGGSLARAQEIGRVEGDVLGVHVGTLLGRPPVTLPPTASVREAARMMRDERVSCILVTDAGALTGIFTDRDLRNRVVAADLDGSTALAQVMSPGPVSLEARASAFDAMLLMSRHNIRHLPVTREGVLEGCITTTNLVRLQAPSAVYLVGDLHKQETAAGMAAVLRPLPDLVWRLADAGLSASNIGHVVSAVTDAATVRLVRLAEKALGPAPVPYVWAAAGSQGRQEQTAFSDQDNCLILDDSYDEAVHGDYFSSFTRFVCDGLDVCGYVHCPGGTMAMTPTWRLPVREWKVLFRRWVEEPDPKALMLSSIFYDLRLVRGPKALFEAVQGPALERARQNRAFLAHLARHALGHQPPLGFFRHLVLERGGENANKLDLKHKGLIPIIDLARVHALAAGVGAVNTQERLDAVRERGGLSPEGTANLRDALEFIALTRVRHQARRSREGQALDNFLAPADLSPLERSHLKDAFAVVKTMQSALAHAFQIGRL